MKSEADRFRRGCGAKIAHVTRELAEMALHDMKRSSRIRRRTRLVVYRCAYGDHWHVGHERR